LRRFSFGGENTRMGLVIDICRAASCLCCFAIMAFGQQVPLDMPRRGADSNDALIEGHVVLPSGQTVDFNVKIVLRDLKNPLATLYTNKHGEFRFTNLSEGDYYVQALADEKAYEPVTQIVRLGRGEIYELTLMLRKKLEVSARKVESRTISSAELDPNVPYAARKEYEQSARLVSKGNVRDAIQHLQRAIAIYPDYVEARNDLGAQYLKQKQFDEAAVIFREVLAKHPKYFNSCFNLGLVLVEQNRNLEAIAQLNQAIAIDSSRPAAHLWLGVTLMRIGDLAGAERELSTALITGGPDYAVTHYYLAQLHNKRKETAEAVRSLRAYLEAAPRGEFAVEARQLLKELSGNQKLK
jgi:tetratricopeptide (TPR) repeat protein